MTQPPDLNQLSPSKKDALIQALWARIQALTARVAELEAKLDEPAKNSDNSIQPPLQDKKASRDERVGGPVGAHWPAGDRVGCGGGPLAGNN